MRNTITLNGTASSTITGLLIQSLPPISKPMMRTTIEEIDGRDGDIVTELGFSAYDKEITIGLYGTFDINQVIAYFNSEGTVIFSNEPDKLYNYKIINQIDFERLVRYRTATVTMHCQPFKYPTTATPVDLTANLVTGEGTDFKLDNTTEAVFSEITPKGDTFQQTYTGKNLLNIYANYNAGWTDTQNGITIKLIEDGGIQLSGTASNAATFNLLGNSWSGSTITTPLNDNKDYYLSHSRTDSNIAFYIRGLKNGSVVSLASSGNHSISSCTGVTLVQIQVESGKSVNGVLYLQLEEGSAATAFEPYVGGIPSPNPAYPQDVKIVTGTQKINISSVQLLTKNGMATPSTDTDFWYSFSSTISQTPKENGWGNIKQISSGYGNFWVKTSAIERLKPSTEYTMIVELKNVVFSGTTGSIDYISTGNSGDPFDGDITVVTGASGSSATVARTLFASPDAVSVIKATTKSTLPSSGIRPFTRNNVPVGTSFDIRITMLEGDHSLDWQNYIGDNWRAYNTSTYTLNLTPNSYDSSTSDNNVYIKQDGTEGTSNNWTRTAFIPVTPGETCMYSGVTIPGNAPYSAYYNSNQEFVSSFKTVANTTNVLTIPDDITYMRFSVEKTDKDTFRFERMSQGIQLKNIYNMQDYIFKNGDKWYVKYKTKTIKLDGTEGWTKTGQVYRLGGVSSDLNTATQDGTAKCKYYTYWPNTGSGISTTLPDGQFGFAQDRSNINFRNTAIADVTAWKASLVSRPLFVYYALNDDAVYDEEITDSTLISQLNALASSNSYKGGTYILTSSIDPTIPVIIKASASKNIDSTVTNAGNIYSRPKLTITGSGNVGIYLNGNQMFQIELGDEGYITIDTDAQEAYKDSPATLKNRLVTGDYSKFKLNPGANQIGFTGIVTEAVIENYTRWL